MTVLLISIVKRIISVCSRVVIIDSASHDVPVSSRAKTNDWGYMMPPIIKKKDTASLDIANGSRPEMYTTSYTNPPMVADQRFTHQHTQILLLLLERTLFTKRNVLTVKR